MKLNADARAVLAGAGMTPGAWARVNFMPGTWAGDACGCRDDRCAGYHHDESEECLCLRASLNLYRDGKGIFAEDAAPPPVQRDDGSWYRPRTLTASEVTDYDEETSVVVFGTRNPRIAQPLADRLAVRLYGSGYRAADPVGVWWRDGFADGRRCWVTDETHGRAGVWFRQIVEAESEH